MVKDKDRFLEGILGETGARALAKAADASADLEYAIFARSILEWLGVLSNTDYEGVLPNTGIPFALTKTEAGFDGSLLIGKNPYAFSKSTLFHVAGSVAVALGVSNAPTLINDKSILKLSKSVGLLVKSRAVQELSKKGIQEAGQVAVPHAPMAPTPPTNVQPKIGASTPNVVGTKAGTSERVKAKRQPTPESGGAPTAPKPKKVVLPGTKPPKPPVPVGKSELQARCTECGGTQFSKEKFVGCPCFQDLASQVSTLRKGVDLYLKFGKLEHQDVLTILEALGK